MSPHRDGRTTEQLRARLHQLRERLHRSDVPDTPMQDRVYGFCSERCQLCGYRLAHVDGRGVSAVHWCPRCDAGESG